MNRADEFGLGSTCIEKDQQGNETQTNAIDLVGGKRDQDTSILPQDRPAPTRRRAGPLGPDTPQDDAWWSNEIWKSRSE